MGLMVILRGYNNISWGGREKRKEKEKNSPEVLSREESDHIVRGPRRCCSRPFVTLHLYDLYGRFSISTKLTDTRFI